MTANSNNPGSSDTVPVYYPNPVTKQLIYNQGRDYIPTFVQVTFSTPTYAPLDVRGNSTGYRDQINRFGQVFMTITKTNHNGSFGPSYEEITCDGVTYVIQVGARVQVPANVYNIITLTNNISAVLG